ncbi:MAG: hypothetical protein ACT4TC_16075, partial [Myxococcaceae bacterium]
PGGAAPVVAVPGASAPAGVAVAPGGAAPMVAVPGASAPAGVAVAPGGAAPMVAVPGASAPAGTAVVPQATSAGTAPVGERSFLTTARGNFVQGTAQGTAVGVTDTATRSETWENGVAKGIGATAEAGVQGGAVGGTAGVLVGGVFSGIGGALGRLRRAPGEGSSPAPAGTGPGTTPPNGGGPAPTRAATDTSGMTTAQRMALREQQRESAARSQSTDPGANARALNGPEAAAPREEPNPQVTDEYLKSFVEAQQRRVDVAALRQSILDNAGPQGSVRRASAEHAMREFESLQPQNLARDLTKVPEGKLGEHYSTVKAKLEGLGMHTYGFDQAMKAHLKVKAEAALSSLGPDREMNAVVQAFKTFDQLALPSDLKNVATDLIVADARGAMKRELKRVQGDEAAAKRLNRALSGAIHPDFIRTGRFFRAFDEVKQVQAETVKLSKELEKLSADEKVAFLQAKADRGSDVRREAVRDLLEALPR